MKINGSPRSRTPNPRSFFGALLLALALLCGGQAKADLITWTGVPDGYVNDSYDILFFYGSGPYSWEVVPGSDPLPDGLAFSNFQFQGSTALELKGTPTSVGRGTYNVTLRVTYSTGLIDLWKFTIIIKPEYSMSIISPSSPFLPKASLGEAYTQTFKATGGVLPYTWSIEAEPPGLDIDTRTGVLSGTPTTKGTFTFQVSVTDNAGFTKTRRYTLIVTDTPVITNTNPLPNGLLNTAYRVQLTGKLGTTPYTFAVTGLNLPPGLSMTSGGLITGTPTVEGTYQFELTISDSSSPAKTNAQQFTINVYGLDINPKILPDGMQNSPYPLPADAGATTLTLSGGKPPFRFRITKGKLPSGIAWYPSGNTVTFRGFPRAGTANFTLAFADASGQKGEQQFAFTVAPAGTPAISTPAALANGKVGQPYSVALQSTGAPAPYLWRILTPKTLPKGIFVSSTGVVSGTPTVAGNYSFAVRVTANNRKTSSLTFTLTVDP
ncbi:MAG: Ig domain-containing protein [Terrimicrobiaceae bacterium]